jgi:hypothetical protein
MKAVLALPMALLLALSVPALAKDDKGDKGDKGDKDKGVKVRQVLSWVRAFP